MEPVHGSTDEGGERRQQERRAVRQRLAQGASRYSIRRAAGGAGRPRGGTGDDAEAASAPPMRMTEREEELDELETMRNHLRAGLGRQNPTVDGHSALHHVAQQARRSNAVHLPIVYALLRVEERRSKLLGLDAPRQREVAVLSEKQLEELIADLESGNAALRASGSGD